MERQYGALGLHDVHVVYQPTTLTTLDTEQASIPKESNEHWLFLGRISKEKGILELVESWPRAYGLAVLGDGPDMVRLRELAMREGMTVDVYGYVEQSRMEEILRGSVGLIVPSTWREGAPGIYADALARGVAVTGLKGNAVYDMVKEDGTGVTIETMSSHNLVRALEGVSGNREQLSARCREVYLQRYSPQAWLTSIRSVYDEVLAGARRKP